MKLDELVEQVEEPQLPKQLPLPITDPPPVEEEEYRMLDEGCPNCWEC